MQGTSQQNGEITFTQQYSSKTDSNNEDPLASIVQSKGAEKMDQVKEVNSSSEMASSPRDMEVTTSPKQEQEQKIQTDKKSFVGHRRYVLELYGQRYQAEKEQSQDTSSEKVAV